MPRRAFIGYEGNDRNQAKGFNLLRWNKNVKVEFVGRHLLDPVKSRDPDYVSRKIREQIKGTSVSIFLIGKHTASSEWVQKEIKWSLEKDPPNGILGIKLDPDAPVPDALRECGAEVIEWEPHQFAEAIERAARQAGRAKALGRAGSLGGGGCVR